MEWTNGNYHITDSKKNIDMDFIIDSLHKTYWAENRPKELIVISIENSSFMSLFDNQTQIGFARIVGDNATYAYICDVYISEKYRGKGLGKFLMQCVMDHPSTKVKNKSLGTKDAHGFYEKFGFVKSECMSNKNE
jgi:GNAT superfamily N-acetyltransferase